MALDTAGGLASAVRDAGLLEPSQVQELFTRWLPACVSVRDLAGRLSAAGWLTPFQVQALLAGRAADLVLGPYSLLDRLGTGGMGEVFKARHRHGGHVCALKVLRRQQPDQLPRFLREAQAAAQLAHPNIVTVYEAGEARGLTYLAMELLEGVDLGKLIEQAGALPVAQACDFIRQAALGLQHAHERGLVHRDVKPSNLLVLPGPAPRRDEQGDLSGIPAVAAPFVGGTVKVLDLGLVRLPASGPDEHRLTQPGVVLGTVDYLAPEQAADSRAVDARADIYSLGCTLYFLLAGRPPFPGGLPLEKLLRHREEQARPVGEIRPGLPAGLQAVVARMLAKAPEDRFATAEEVADALIPWLNYVEEVVFVAPHREPPTGSGYDSLPVTRVMRPEDGDEERS